VTAVTGFEPAAGLAPAAAARAPAAATMVAAQRRRSDEAGTPRPSVGGGGGPPRGGGGGGGGGGEGGPPPPGGGGGGRPHRLVVVVERRWEGPTGSRGRAPRVRTRCAAARDQGRRAVARAAAPRTHRGDARDARARATVTWSDHAPAKTAEACDTIAVARPDWCHVFRSGSVATRTRGWPCVAFVWPCVALGSALTGARVHRCARPPLRRTVAPHRSPPCADASTIGLGWRGARISPRRRWRRPQPARCGRGASTRSRGPGATQCAGGGRRRPTGGHGPHRRRRRPSAVAPPPRRRSGGKDRSGRAAAAAAAAAGKTGIGFPHGPTAAAVKAGPPPTLMPSADSWSVVGYAWGSRPPRRSRRRRNTGGGCRAPQCRGAVTLAPLVTRGDHTARVDYRVLLTEEAHCGCCAVSHERPLLQNPSLAE